MVFAHIMRPRCSALTSSLFLHDNAPFIFAILGGAVAAFYLLKLYTLMEMKQMESQRRDALHRLKHEERPVTPRSEAHSVPVTPDTQQGNNRDDDWQVTDY